MTEQNHPEVDVGNGNTGNSITLTPNTGVSIGMIVTIIGAAIWITSGQSRLEARSQRLEELVVELKNSVSSTSRDTETITARLAEDEARYRAEFVRLTMIANENRRKIGLPTTPDFNPYQDQPTGRPR